MADELKMVPQGRAAQRNKKVSKGIFPGDFKNFVESKEFKDSKKKQKDKYEKDKQHPVIGKHAGFDRLVNSGKKKLKLLKHIEKIEQILRIKLELMLKKVDLLKRKKVLEKL